MLVNVDVKYLDWLAAVWLSQDEVAMKEIIDGTDLHSDNQKAFNLPSRLIAKVFLFRIIFGGGAYSFSLDPDFKDTGLSEKQWEDVISKFYKKYDGIRRWHESLVQRAMVNKRLAIATGRTWEFTKGYDRRGEVKWPITLIKNYPVQGLEADLMMIVRVSLMKRIKHEPDILLVNSVHDSVLLDVPSRHVDWTVDVIRSVFRDVPDNFRRLFGVSFNLPFRGEISVGNDWLNMKEVT